MSVTFLVEAGHVYRDNVQLAQNPDEHLGYDLVDAWQGLVAFIHGLPSQIQSGAVAVLREQLAIGAIDGLYQPVATVRGSLDHWVRWVYLIDGVDIPESSPLALFMIGIEAGDTPETSVLAKQLDLWLQVVL